MQVTCHAAAKHRLERRLMLADDFAFKDQRTKQYAEVTGLGTARNEPCCHNGLCCAARISSSCAGEYVGGLSTLPCAFLWIVPSGQVFVMLLRWTSSKNG